MKRLLWRAKILFAGLLAMGCAGFAQPHGGGDIVAIVGADVLPMSGPQRLRDQTVLIRGDRIVGIGPRSRLSIPSGARRIQARGLTLMPGLVDMHVHLAPEAGQPGDAAQRAMAVMLAHGITTARGMAGSPSNLLVRDAVEQGRLAGPRFYAAAPGLHINSAPTPAAAREAVVSAGRAGYDLIKSHHIVDVAVWQAVQEEARRQGLPTAGHVTNQVGLDRAMAARQQVEHLDAILYELLPSTAPERQLDFAQIPPPAVVAAASRASDAQIDAIAARAAAAGSWHVPTLALFERHADLDRPVSDLLAAPEMRWVPDAALEQWTAQRAQFLAQSGYTAETGVAFRELRRRIVRALHRRGVPLMAGSDTAQSFHLWGPGLIREVEALAAAGLSPMEALRSATVVPRDYFRSLPRQGSHLGWPANFGTVEVGARADLILLRGDPSRDIANLRRLDTVIARGRVYDRAALDALLDQAALDAKRARPQQSSAPARQIYVMRHLQAADGSDPGLTSGGEAHARRLAGLLAEADIRALFVTDTRRARDTVRHLADRLGLEPRVYNPADPAALAAAAASTDGNLLVIGHSNTVPDLVERFGGARSPALAHNDFGTIWRVDSGARLVREFSVTGPPPAVLKACSDPGFPAGSRCGTVRVEENRTAPNGRLLDIHFAVVPATGEGGDAPLIFLPGGPGLGGAQSAPGTVPLFEPMRSNRDLLFIDQRGTGASNGLHCPQDESAGEETARARACRETLSRSADLTRYATREAVLDMEAIRSALGYPRVDLFGLSYGTRPALDYLRLYPDRVGQTVIRAAAPVSMKLPLYAPRDAQASFDLVVAACRAQTDCAARHPDLDRRLSEAIARLRQGPVKVALVDPKSGQPKQEVLSLDQFASTMFFLLYINDFYVQIPPLIEKAAKGDFAPLMQAVMPFTSGTVSQIAWGLRWSVICGEDVPQIRGEEIGPATRASFMGAASVEGEIANCRLWPRPHVPSDYLQPFRSDKPVFIISGEMDPIAGPRWGNDIAAGLPNSRHLVLPGTSHLPPLPGCSADLVRAFLDGTPLAGLDLACAAGMDRPRLRVAA